MKQWTRELATSIIANLVTPLVAALIGLVGLGLGITVLFLGDNLNTALLLVLIALVLINVILTASMQKSQAEIRKTLDRHFPSSTVELDPEAHDLERRLFISDKHFDAQSRPQKIVLQFTNRGSEIIHTEKVRFATADLPKSALVPSYATEDGHYYVIQHQNADVHPKGNLPVEIALAQVWDEKNITSLAGKWGYIKIDVLNNSKPVTLFYSI